MNDGKRVNPHGHFLVQNGETGNRRVGNLAASFRLEPDAHSQDYSIDRANGTDKSRFAARRIFTKTSRVTKLAAARGLRRIRKPAPADEGRRPSAGIAAAHG